MEGNTNSHESSSVFHMCTSTHMHACTYTHNGNTFKQKFWKPEVIDHHRCFQKSTNFSTYLQDNQYFHLYQKFTMLQNPALVFVVLVCVRLSAGACGGQRTSSDVTRWNTTTHPVWDRVSHWPGLIHETGLVVQWALGFLPSPPLHCHYLGPGGQTRVVMLGCKCLTSFAVTLPGPASLFYRLFLMLSQVWWMASVLKTR